MKQDTATRLPRYRYRRDAAQGGQAGYQTGFLIFPDFDLLQLSAPLEALRLAGGGNPAVMSLDGGLVQSSCGLAVQTRPVTAAGLDTLIITGGAASQAIPRLPELADFACAASAMLRRIAGIGTGAFVLGEAGLLDGRHAALDREFSERFSRAYPAVRSSSGRVFVNDRGIWTASDSAAGLELCLGLIEEDFGPEICRAIAPCLPVHPGKSQYVAPEDLSPAEAADRSRAEAALQQVQAGREPFEAIARAAGFRDAEEMRRGFLRFFGQPPQALRRAARLARKAQDRRKIARLPTENGWSHPATRPGVSDGR